MRATQHISCNLRNHFNNYFDWASVD